MSANASVDDVRLKGRPVERVVFSADDIAARVRALGREITDYYRGSDLLVLGLLKGSFIFLSDLVRNIQLPLQVDFLVASSYGRATESAGQVNLLYDPETKLAGRHIILVEDIVDSGRTVAKLVDVLRARGPLSLEVCALLHKNIATELEQRPRFVGFDAPGDFLVGYGLDHAEDFRHLPYIASLK
jgi:hypoxanthine phosphoribosyltransferase